MSAAAIAVAVMSLTAGYIIPVVPPRGPAPPCRFGQRHCIRCAASGDGSPQVDVSDLGLTMDDLEMPMEELLSGIESSGYQSTSRASEDGG